MLDNRGYKAVFGGKIDDAHPALQPFRTYPKFENLPKLYYYIPVSAMFAILAIAGFIISKLTKTLGSEAYLIGAVAYPLAFRTFFGLTTYRSFFGMAKQAAEDKLKMHAARGERHVGIAYYDAIW